MAQSGALPAASSGLPGLDDALGGLLRGDNLLWTVEGDGDPVPFYRAATGSDAAFDRRIYVTLTDPPERVATRFPGVAVVDGRPGAPLGRPGALLDHLHRRVREGRRPLVLLDPVEAMATTWGPGLASRFLARCTVLLLELNAVSYWSVRPDRVPGRLGRQVQDAVQCAVVLEADRLRVTKAEGHPPSAAGSVLTYRLDDGGLPADLREAPPAQRLGSALRALRQRRRLTQHDLGEAAGVSASAISQAERGQRGLSFATLLELTGRLQISFEELLDGGDPDPWHRVGRRREGAEPTGEDELLPAGPGPSVSVVRLGPGRSVAPGPGGHLVVIACAGVVEVQSAGGRCVLRGGDVMTVHGAGVQGLRDLGSGSTVYLVRSPEPR